MPTDISTHSLAAAGFAASLLLAIPAQAGRLGAVEEGKSFPNLVLPTAADGSPFAVSQLRGKKTVLHVFASW